MSQTHTTLNALLQEYQADYFIYQDDFNLSSAEAGAKHYGITLNETTPTLILKANDRYFAAIICGNTRLSFKKLKEFLQASEVKLADPATVLTMTGAKIGEVSLINEKLPTLIDQQVLNNKYCYGGSGISHTTLKINTTDLVRITQAKIFDFTDQRT